MRAGTVDTSADAGVEFDHTIWSSARAQTLCHVPGLRMLGLGHLGYPCCHSPSFPLALCFEKRLCFLFCVGHVRKWSNNHGVFLPYTNVQCDRGRFIPEVCQITGAFPTRSTEQGDVPTGISVCSRPLSPSSHSVFFAVFVGSSLLLVPFLVGHSSCPVCRLLNIIGLPISRAPFSKCFSLQSPSLRLSCTQGRIPGESGNVQESIRQ